MYKNGYLRILRQRVSGENPCFHNGKWLDSPWFHYPLPSSYHAVLVASLRLSETGTRCWLFSTFRQPELATNAGQIQPTLHQYHSISPMDTNEIQWILSWKKFPNVVSSCGMRSQFDQLIGRECTIRVEVWTGGASNPEDNDIVTDCDRQWQNQRKFQFGLRYLFLSLRHMDRFKETTQTGFTCESHETTKKLWGNMGKHDETWAQRPRDWPVTLSVLATHFGVLNVVTQPNDSKNLAGSDVYQDPRASTCAPLRSAMPWKLGIWTQQFQQLSPVNSILASLNSIYFNIICLTFHKASNGRNGMTYDDSNLGSQQRHG